MTFLFLETKLDLSMAPLHPANITEYLVITQARLNGISVAYMDIPNSAHLGGRKGFSSSTYMKQFVV